jgi:hypothetical protein
LLVENTILFISQSRGEITVIAVFAVETERSIITMVAIQKILAVVTSRAAGTLIRKFTLFTTETVQGILRIKNSVAVVTVFIMITDKNKVTILIVGGTIGVIAVLIIGDKSGRMGYNLHQLPKLFKETSLKIKVFAIRQSFPTITPPLALVIDFKGLIGTVNRNDLFAGEIALAIVEHPFITKRHTPLQTTVRT